MYGVTKVCNEVEVQDMNTEASVQRFQYPALL